MADLKYKINASADAMANEIFGDGVQVVGASYSGANAASGTYSKGDANTPGVTPGDTGVILSTGKVKDFTNKNGDPNTDTLKSTDNNTNDGLAEFDDLAGTDTYDAASLSIDFRPTGDVLSMQFVFSSDEFPEYINSLFTDAVGVWLDGELIPLEIGGNVTVDNLGDPSNLNLYNDNTGDAYNTEMDGFTMTLTLKIPVVSGDLHSLKIGIADVGDGQGDSNLLIAGGSLQTTTIAEADVFNMDAGDTETFDVLGNDTGSGTLTVTHINGISVGVGSTINLASGHSLTLNFDGTFTVVADSDEDAVNFNYSIEDSNGNTDVGMVTINTVPCFVRGTLIETPQGEVPVEELQAGDLITTLDNGTQPLRWLGQRKVPAVDNLAPICIAAGTFGPHRELRVSPQHRILFQDQLAELLFAEYEVLVKAKDLVNGDTVTIVEGGVVEYFHLLFDDHEIVFSNGLATESYLPGLQSADAFQSDVYQEICSIFPEIDPETGLGYGDAGRMMLKGYEAKVLLASAGIH